jgi:hypothetical protein
MFQSFTFNPQYDYSKEPASSDMRAFHAYMNL